MGRNNPKKVLQNPGETIIAEQMKKINDANMNYSCKLPSLVDLSDVSESESVLCFIFLKREHNWYDDDG